MTATNAEKVATGPRIVQLTEAHVADLTEIGRMMIITDDPLLLTPTTETPTIGTDILTTGWFVRVI